MTEEKAPFNMAIATLMRIDAILTRIYEIEQNIMLDIHTRQSQKLLLVKELFMQSAGLLTAAQIEKHQEEILNLKPVEIQTLIKYGMITRTNGMRVIYDEVLEKTLNEFIIIVQICLQNQKYLMPPRKDPSKIVGEM